MTDKADDASTAFLQSTLMGEVRDYLQRGRRFETVATPQLSEKWTVAFRAFVQAAVVSEAGNRPSDHDTQDLDDASAELRLRGFDLPLEAVQHEASVLLELIRTAGPDMPPSVDQQIDQFLADRKKPKN